MSKGHLDPVFVKGFSQDEIAECKQKWVQSEPITESKKTAGVTQWDMSEEVYELLVQKYKGVFGFIHTQEVYRDACCFAMDVCRKHRKGWDEYSLRKLVQPAYARFEHCKTQLVDKMVDKFSLDKEYNHANQENV